MAEFTIPCDPSQITEEVHFNTLITVYETGKEQRRSKGEPYRVWTIRFQKLKADADAIWDFYTARKGAFEAFTWKSPLDGLTYNVRFADDILSKQTFWKIISSYGIRLKEVI